MRKRIIWILVGGVILAAVAAIAWGPIVSNVEQAKYDVVETHGTIEIRDYSPMIVAEVSVSGDREEAISAGFRMIADYIFGNNISSQKVAMTAPVIEEPSEKIAMTAPVTQQGGEEFGWYALLCLQVTRWKRFPSRITRKSSLMRSQERDLRLSVFQGFPSQIALKSRAGSWRRSFRKRNFRASQNQLMRFLIHPGPCPFCAVMKS